MKINLGIATITADIKWTWNIGTEAKVLKVLKENGKIAAIKYYRNDLNNCNIELKTSKEYVDAIEVKYGLR